MVQKILQRVSGEGDMNSHSPSANVRWVRERGTKLGRRTTWGHLMLKFALNTEVCTVYLKKRAHITGTTLPTTFFSSPHINKPHPLRLVQPGLSTSQAHSGGHWRPVLPSGSKLSRSSCALRATDGPCYAHESTILLFWSCGLEGVSYVHVKYMYTFI